MPWHNQRQVVSEGSGGSEILSIGSRISSGIYFLLNLLLNLHTELRVWANFHFILAAQRFFFPSQVPRAVAATTATTATTTTNCCHDRPTFMNVLFLYFGHAAFCYTISIKAQPRYLKNPLSARQGYLSATCSTWHLESGQWHWPRHRQRLRQRHCIWLLLRLMLWHIAGYCGKRQPLASPLTFPFKRLFTSSRFVPELSSDPARLWSVSCLRLG